LSPAHLFDLLSRDLTEQYGLLTEQIGSLTAERDSLKLRVEELEKQCGEHGSGQAQRDVQPRQFHLALSEGGIWVRPQMAVPEGNIHVQAQTSFAEEITQVQAQMVIPEEGTEVQAQPFPAQFSQMTPPSGSDLHVFPPQGNENPYRSYFG
jgi:hypothetical protein